MIYCGSGKESKSLFLNFFKGKIKPSELIIFKKTNDFKNWRNLFTGMLVCIRPQDGLKLLVLV